MRDWDELRRCPIIGNYYTLTSGIDITLSFDGNHWGLYFPATYSHPRFSVYVATIIPRGRSVSFNGNVQSRSATIPDVLCRLATILFGPPYRVAYDKANVAWPFRLHYHTVDIPLGRTMYISTETLAERRDLKQRNAPIIVTRPAPVGERIEPPPEAARFIMSEYERIFSDIQTQSPSR